MIFLKRICIILTLLVVFLGSLTCYAENSYSLGINDIISIRQQQNNAGTVPFDWAVKVYCSGDEVNLRQTPSTQSPVVGNYDKGAEFYLLTIVDGPDYNWAMVMSCERTPKVGFMAGPYIRTNDVEMTRAARFHATLFSSAFVQSLSTNETLMGKALKEPLTPEEKNTQGYVEIKYVFPGIVYYGQDIKDDDSLLCGIVSARGYKMAGMTVFDELPPDRFATLKKDLEGIGWRYGGSHNEKKPYIEHVWHYFATVDGQERPVKGFYVSLDNNNKITGLRWHVFLID